MISLRPYQRECVDAFYRYFDNGGTGHPLIVVPTAGGKSIVIGILATEIVQRWPSQRIIILSHVKELILQNYDKILKVWPAAPCGIYSAAVGRRQAHHPIVVASLQSVYNKAHLIGHRDLCFIDESHLLQPGGMGMYGQLLTALTAINPAMKVCGLTATDYRLDSGLLTEGDGSLFTDVIVEISIKQLLDEGYLTPPVSKPMLVQANLEGVKTTAGDYNIKQMAERFDQREFLNAALDSDMPLLHDRKSIAAFCATVENAQHVAEGMTARGLPTEVIDGEMPQDMRDERLARFKSGALRGMASVGVMTTGTDIPGMDCILLFRATKSPGLYQQIIGRGFRVVYAPGYDLDTREGRLDAIRNGTKPNFLTLDHGGNIERYGAITHIQKPQRLEKGERRKLIKAEIRICECCRSAWPLDIRICGTCGTEMVKERDATANLEVEASAESVLGTPFSRGEAAQWFDVEDVRYYRHAKPAALDSLRVTYYCGIMQFNEWIQLNIPANSTKKYMRENALKWWNWRAPGGRQNPVGLEQAMEWVGFLARPARVLVRKNDKFFEVQSYEFAEQLKLMEA